MSVVDIGAERLFNSFCSVELIELCTANQIEINEFIQSVTKRISPYSIACVIREQTIAY